MQARWEECDLLSGNGGRPLSVCNFRSGQICDGVELASKQDSGLSDPYVDAETTRHERFLLSLALHAMITASSEFQP